MKKLLLFGITLSFLISCTKEKEEVEIIKPTEKVVSSEITNRWVEKLLKFVRYQPLNSPTYISRAMGYMGLTLYETVVNGSIIYQSIAPELNGLGDLPKPTGEIDWETALNEGQYYMVFKMWQHSQNNYKLPIDSLYNDILIQRTMVVKDTAIINRSKRYGASVAEKIYNWSITDGGNLGYLNNFDFKYKIPQGLQYWTPPSNGQSSILAPMAPAWGKNRPMVALNGSIPIPQIMDYSTDKNSKYFAEFKEVYDMNVNLTKEQKELALWWGDDPSESAAPAGHSYNLARQLVQLKKLNLFEAASVYAKVGLSVADAFVCCWKVKYTYHSVRPTPYILRNIKMPYEQFWPEPPFPAFPSGHSSQGAATATALISVFGNDVSFTDNTHVPKIKDYLRNVDYKARSFTTIWQTAEECGISRLYGGIHTRQDNVVGLDLGKKVGENITNLHWKKTTASM